MAALCCEPFRPCPLPFAFLRVTRAQPEEDSGHGETERVNEKGTRKRESERERERESVKERGRPMANGAAPESGVVSR